VANAQGQVSYTSQSTTNSYNASGQRIRKVENGATTKYFYSGSVNLFTTNENNVLLTENILDLSGSIIASLRFEDENPNTPDPYAGKYFFFNYDVRGSTTAILQPDGAMVKGYEYDVFGSLSQSGATDFLNEVTFTGSVSDLSSGLQYMNARFYNPSTGRFLSQDSYSGNAYDPWTQHLYSYSGNNPTSMVDPTGHFFNLAAGLIGAAIGGVAGVLGNGIANVINGQDFFENSGSALLGGVITGLAAGVTCGASLIATGAGMLAVTGVSGLGMVSTAAGAYGISSMAASATTQAIEKGPQNIDTGEIMLSGAIGALTAAVFTGVGEAVRAVKGSIKTSQNSATSTD
jgi:RHS repeat-associated protein